MKKRERTELSSVVSSGDVELGQISDSCNLDVCRGINGMETFGKLRQSRARKEASFDAKERKEMTDEQFGVLTK